MAPCNSTFTTINMQMYCTRSGFFMSTNLGSGSGTNTVCPPGFSVQFTIPISGCAPAQVFVVTGP
jgi:hypothetical protein